MLETSSTMKDEAPSPLNQRLARRVRELRTATGQSLEALAAQVGVSRSMLSLIERGESSPTAVLLEKLAAGLGVSLASLFDPGRPGVSPVSRALDQTSWRDPLSGYLRKNISPGGGISPIQIVEVVFPPQARVAYETGARAAALHQQVWVLQGEIEVTVGEQAHHLQAGDCLAMALDRPTAFHNPGEHEARYAVVITNPPTAWR
jgi:transcriptional regulator with XRE-family HTH domain